MNEDTRKALFWLVRVMRALAIFAVFLLAWLTVSFAFRATHLVQLPDSAAVTRGIRIALLPFVFFSSSRIFAEEDTALNEALGKPQKAHLLARCRALLCEPLYLLELGILLLLTVLLPYDPCCTSVVALLFRISGAPRAVVKLLALAIFLPLLLLLSLLSHLSAWQKHLDGAGNRGEVKKSDTAGGVRIIARPNATHYYGGTRVATVTNPSEPISAEERRRLYKGRTGSSLYLNLFLLFLLYGLGGLLLTFFIPVVISFFNVLIAIGETHWWLPVLLIVGVILFVITYHVLRALSKRRALIKKLKKTCATYGFRHSKLRRPYRSLFRLGDEVSFTLYANGKEYDCKLFGTIRRHTPLFFHESGVVYCAHSIRFRRVELLSFTTSYRFDFKSDREKLCIVAPVPKEIFAGDEHWHRPIDTGTLVGGYRIFSTTGFIGALRRDCLDRGK